nr:MULTISPECIES: hypothetical protein [unclassified Coleofasciculus]
MGPTLHRWREEWQERIPKNPASDLPLPVGQMCPVGYIVLQHGVRFDRPVKAFQQWIARIPQIYSEEVIQQPEESHPSLANDPNCLALLKHYQSLMPMAQEAHKPIFHLKPADGAIGAHITAVKGVYWDFKDLAHKVAARTQLPLPDEQLV